MKYNWKRFLCKRDDNYISDYDTYLSDPEEERGIINSHVLSLDQLDSMGCVVIVGEPGIGKSTALEDELQRLNELNDVNSMSPIIFRMEQFSNETNLREIIFDSKEWNEWKDNGKILYLFIDSLDEVRLRIETACSIILEELRKVDRERIRLRICCRSAYWPIHFEKDLHTLWESEENYEVFQMLPLRICDVKDAANKYRVDFESFFKEVSDKYVHSFAAKPVTLETLLEEFKVKKTLPDSQWDIYEKLCLKLCDDPNPRYHENKTLRASYKLDKETRLNIASQIAAVMMLSNLYSLNKSAYCKIDDKEVLNIEDLNNNDKFTDFYKKDEYEEALKTGLFWPLTNNTDGFSHKTYLEFLAARYLHNISYKRLFNILTTRCIDRRKVIPQLSELVSWCSMRNKKLRNWLIRNQPEILIDSDLSVCTNKDKSSLVESLFFYFEKKEIFDNYMFWGNGKKLKNPNIANQIRPYIESIDKNIHTRLAAIDLSGECELNELYDSLIDLVLNPNENVVIRRHSCYALEKINGDFIRNGPKQLLLDDNELDDDLKGSLLILLWPNNLSIEEFLQVATEPKDLQNLAGYGHFLLSADKDFPVEYIANALEHFKNKNVFNLGFGYAFKHFVSRIFIRGVQYIHVLRMQECLVRFMLEMKKQSHCFLEHDENKLFLTIIEGDQTIRRKLLSGILNVAEEENYDNYDVDSCLRSCCTWDDYFWFIDEVDNHIDKIKVLLLEFLLSYLYHHHEGCDFTSKYIDSWLNKLKMNGQIKETFLDILYGVDLNSEKALRGREYVRKNKDNEKKAEDRKKKLPKAENIIADNLPKAKEGDPNAWYWLCMALGSEEELIKNRIVPGYISNAKRFNQLSIEEKGEICEAAIKFLISNAPKDHGWLTTQQKTCFIVTGRFALSIIGYNESFLTSLPKEILANWIPTIIGLWGDPDEGFYKTMKYAYDNCCDTFFKYLNIKMDFDNQQENPYCGILDRLHVLIDDQLIHFLIQKLKIKELKSGIFRQICDLLMHNPKQDFINVLIEKISPPWQQNENDLEITSLCLGMILTNWPANYWDKIQRCMKEAPELTKKGIAKVGCKHRRDKEKKDFELNPKQLAELYIWLKVNCVDDYIDYHGEYDGQNWDLRDIRNYAITTLTQMGTQDAIEALEFIHTSLQEENKDYIKRCIEEAKDNFRREYWNYYTPKQVIQFYYEETKRKFNIKLIFITLVLILELCTLSQFDNIGWIKKWSVISIIITITISIWWYCLPKEQKEIFKNLKNNFLGWKTS